MDLGGGGICQTDTKEWQCQEQKLTAAVRFQRAAPACSASWRKQEKGQLLHHIICALVAFVFRLWL